MLATAQSREQTAQQAGVAILSRSRLDTDPDFWQASPWYVDPLSTGDVFGLPRREQAARNRWSAMDEGAEGMRGNAAMPAVGQPTPGETPAAPGPLVLQAESLGTSHQAVVEGLAGAAFVEATGIVPPPEEDPPGTRAVYKCSDRHPDDFVGSVSVPATDPAWVDGPFLWAASDVPKHHGKYTLIARGDVIIDTFSDLGADADYYNFTNPIEPDVRLLVQGAGGMGYPWDVYRSNHVYYRHVTGQDATVRFSFQDAVLPEPYYANNSGSLTVEVWCGWLEIPPSPPPPCQTPVLIDTQRSGGGPGSFSPGAVQYRHGTLQFASDDLRSDGFGSPCGVTRSFANHPAVLPDGFAGAGTVIAQLPFVLKYDPDPANTNPPVGVVTSATSGLNFDWTGSAYVPRLDGLETLTHDYAGAMEFVLADMVGNRLRFSNFHASLPAYQQGQFKSLTDPYGNVTTADRGADGKVTEVWRQTGTGAATVRDSYLYTYYTSGVVKGMLQKVTLRRGTGSPLVYTTVREVEYEYHTRTPAAEYFGPTGTLKRVRVKAPGGAVLDTEYYRYYKPGDADYASGYLGGLKYAFRDAAYNRMVQAGLDPLTAADAAVAPYADLSVKYAADHRVTEQKAAGLGCSYATGCSDGLGTLQYTYTINPNEAHAPGMNSWAFKTVEKHLDTGGAAQYEKVVYTNTIGRVMLTDMHRLSDPNTRWVDFYKYYDSADPNERAMKGRLILHANPSAVLKNQSTNKYYDDAYADLMHWLGTEYEYLSNSAGLIETTSYYASTTATESTAGGVQGYEFETFVQRGEQGTPARQRTQNYRRHTAHAANGGAVIYVVDSEKVYRNAGDTDGPTTSSSYGWHDNPAGSGQTTNRIASRTVSQPVVTTAQNGPNVAVTETMAYDTFGRATSTTDADSFVTTHTYDTATGATTQTVVNSGGLNLTTAYQVDAFGRTTKVTEPNGNVTYTVYKDAQHEVRTYPGWDTTSAPVCNAVTPCTTGPIQVTREDRARGYSETLTISGMPAVQEDPQDPGTYLPTGGEAITTNVKTLSRTHTNKGGQTVYVDRYFNLTGLTYSADAVLAGAVQGTHYSRTYQDYDKRGRSNRGVSANGTITRTVFDVLSRTVSSWVGTNDTGATDADPAGGGATGNNMLKVSESVYDGATATPGTAGVGDGNLTQETHFPGGTAANRVSQSFYDWRNRPVASKSGVQATETDTAVNRPLTYTTYDNLGRATAQELYDGDGVSMQDSGGVPTIPVANNPSSRRALSESSYDEQGRVYRTVVYNINQSTGAKVTFGSPAVESRLQSDTWYNKRGQVIKTAQPGGLVQKTTYDGAGRTVTGYMTDGGGDTTWAHALDVVGDSVLSQSETQYDGSGNVLFAIHKERFHDAAGTGALGTPTVEPKARHYYVSSWYDKANRPTTSAAYGTNGGTVLTQQPASAPSGSDPALVSTTAYNASGWVEDVTDPRGSSGAPSTTTPAAPPRPLRRTASPPARPTPTAPPSTPTTPATTS